MRVLVTGAAGFIGSHLAERLASQGHDVRALDNLSDNYSLALKSLNMKQVQLAGASFLRLDLASDPLAAALDGVEYVYHLAAQPGISVGTGFEAYLRNNVVATQRLVDAAAISGRVRGFLNVSTSSVYGADAGGAEDAEPKPTSLYGVTKLAAEQLVLARARDSGFPACSVRLFSVYGPRERPEKLYPLLIRCLLEGREFPIYEGSLQHSRSFTFVSDAVDGLIGAMGSFARCIGEIFNIGSETSMKTADGIAIVEKLLDQRVRLKVLPRRMGDQLRTHANVKKAKAAFGYSPKASAEEGLAAEIAWYRTQIEGRIRLYKD